MALNSNLPRLPTTAGFWIRAIKRREEQRDKGWRGPVGRLCISKEAEEEDIESWRYTFVVVAAARGIKPFVSAVLFRNLFRRCQEIARWAADWRTTMFQSESKQENLNVIGN